MKVPHLYPLWLDQEGSELRFNREIFQQPGNIASVYRTYKYTGHGTTGCVRFTGTTGSVWIKLQWGHPEPGPQAHLQVASESYILVFRSSAINRHGLHLL